MTTFTSEDHIAVETNDVSTHIIQAKRLLGEIELLIACPTNINHEALEQKLLSLDHEHSQIWVAYDRMRNEQV